MNAEPSYRYRVERRYRVAPPAPYTNKWELVYSFTDEMEAQFCMNDERDEDDRHVYQFRVVDAGFIPAHARRAA